MHGSTRASVAIKQELEQKQEQTQEPEPMYNNKMEEKAEKAPAASTTVAVQAAATKPTQKATIGALREAVRAGDSALVQTMLATGTKNLGNIAQPSDKGPTPLHWAASHGHTEIAKLLMQDDGAWAVLTQHQDS